MEPAGSVGQATSAGQATSTIWSAHAKRQSSADRYQAALELLCPSVAALCGSGDDLRPLTAQERSNKMALPL